MPSVFARLSCGIAIVICQYAASVRADDAASNYLFSVLELGSSVPAYVNSATTDDPDMGFEVVLSDKQKSYLQQPSVAAALDRFDRATSRDECVWSRYSDLSWSVADLNDRLHQLARVALLRARLHFEAGEWIEGNRSVERVRIMARHMTQQARPFEHQCFMVENMANGTAAAYVLQLPQDALADLYKRHIRLGQFSPKANMLRSEAKRIRMLAKGIDADKLTLEKVLEFIDPYLANAADEQRIRKMSHTEIAHELRGLASFLSEHSGLVEVAHGDAERKIAETYRRHSKTSRIVAGWRMPPLGDYRENA